MEEFRTLVLYRTKHGSTRKYANWIADALNGDVMEADKRTANDWGLRMGGYDMVIFGGNLNTSGINGLKEFRAVKARNPVENVAYFCVGSWPESEETTQTHLESNFTPQELEQGVDLFYCRGRLDYIGLGFIDKRIMGGLMKAILKKYPEDRSQGEAELLEAYTDDVDWSGRYYIQPLVDHVKSFMTEEQKAYMEPLAAARVAERMKQEALEEAEWEAEMKRREELYHENQRKEEADKLRRMSKKQRERYLASKAAKEQAEAMDEDLELLASDEGSVDDYSEFEDEKKEEE